MKNQHVAQFFTWIKMFIPYDEKRNKSRFNDIYQNVYQDVPKENISIHLKDDNYFTLKEAQKFLSNLPDEQICKKDAMLNFDHFQEHEKTKLQQINDAIFGMKPSLESGYIEACKMKENMNIKFFNAGFYNSDKENIFKPPRFEVKLAAGISSGTTVCINTGYILTMPMNTKARKILNGKIIKDKTRSTQLRFVILSKLVSNNQGILFTDSTGRDGEDKGFQAFSVTITGEYDFEKWLVFELHAFKVNVPKQISISNIQEEDAKVLKNKDTIDNRNVCTPKIGVLTNEFKLHSESGFVQMKTFDCKNDHKTVYESQTVIIGDAFIVVPRKRNWRNPNIVTTLGIYVPHETLFPPIFVSGSDIKVKAHSFIFISNKIHLFSGDGEPHDNMRFLNGFFKDNVLNYDEIVGYWRKIVKAKEALAYGFMSCNEVCKLDTDLEFWKVLNIFDFHHRINLRSAKEMIHMSDKELFESRKDKMGSYSAIIYHSLCGLARLFGLTPEDDEKTASINSSLISGSHLKDDDKSEILISHELIKRKLDESEYNEPKIIKLHDSLASNDDNKLESPTSPDPSTQSIDEPKIIKLYGSLVPEENALDS